MIQKDSFLNLALETQAAIFRSSLDYWKDKSYLLKLELESEKAVSENLERILERERKINRIVILALGIPLIVSTFFCLYLSK